MYGNYYSLRWNLYIWHVLYARGTLDFEGTSLEWNCLFSVGGVTTTLKLSTNMPPGKPPAGKAPPGKRDFHPGPSNGSQFVRLEPAPSNGGPSTSLLKSTLQKNIRLGRGPAAVSFRLFCGHHI